MEISPHAPIEDLRITVIDTETTGFSPTRDRIVEIGVCTFTLALRDASVDSWLVDPETPIPPGVTEKVHHISDEMVAGAPTIRPALERLADTLAAAKPDIILGHNLGFDLGFLDAEAARVAFAWGRPDGVCTLTLARFLRGPGGNNLGELAQRFQITGRDTLHRAGPDALTTSLVFKSLILLAGSRLRTWADIWATRAVTPGKAR